MLNEHRADRRSLLKTGALAGAALVAGASGASALSSPRPTTGDIAILRLLAAAELGEADLWQQYAELGGVSPGTQNPYQLALQQLDSDGSQYISSKASTSTATPNF